MSNVNDRVAAVVAEAKAEAKAEEERFAKYGEVLKEAREKRAAVAQLLHHPDPAVRESDAVKAEADVLNWEIEDLVSSLEKEEDRANLRVRLAFDDLMDKIRWAINLLREGKWEGNPWVALSRSVEGARDIGFVRLADDTDRDGSRYTGKGRYIGAYVDGGLQPFVPVQPDSKMTKVLFGSVARDKNGAVTKAEGLLGLRAVCKEASENHRALKEHRERRVEVLGTTADDVQAVMNGEGGEVAGYVNWDVSGRTTQQYIEVKAEGKEVHVVDADDALRLRGEETDLSNGRLFAALGLLKKTLSSAAGQNGSKNEESVVHSTSSDDSEEASGNGLSEEARAALQSVQVQEEAS